MVDIRRASRREDFEAVHALVAQLAAWDIGQMEGMGLPTADLVRLYYSETVDDLAAKYGKPNAPAFVGWLEGVPVACAALYDVGGGIAEVHKMFVKPDYRGRGVGRALMESVFDTAQRGGHSLLRLETVTFMVNAIRLYHITGFTYCAPFKTVPDSLRAVTMFMERRV